MANYYCNVTTHLTNEYPEIESYQQKRVVEGWTLVAGQTKTYYKYSTGQVSQVFGDGAKYTVKTSIALVEATASTWYYDNANDILYVQNAASTDPDGATVIEIGKDWYTFKTAIRDNAMEFMNSVLCKIYNVPLMPRSVRTHTSDDYDYVIVRACALLTCAFIMKRINPADPIGDRLLKEVWNTEQGAGEPKGLLNQIVEGDITLTDQVNVKRAGGWMIIPLSTNTITRGPIVEGEYLGATFQVWRIQVETGGAPGTGKYKVSYDGSGSSWNLTGQDMYDAANDEYRMPITSGITVRWPIGVTQVLDEYWDLYLFPKTDTIDIGKVGNIEAGR